MFLQIREKVDMQDLGHIIYMPSTIEGALKSQILYSLATTQMHTANSGCMSVQCMYTLTSVRVPHFKCTVSRPTNYHVPLHL